MYHWDEKLTNAEGKPPKHFIYKGLSFPLLEAALNTDKNINEPEVQYAFFGGRALTTAQICEHVEIMINLGEYRAQSTVA